MPHVREQENDAIEARLEQMRHPEKYVTTKIKLAYDWLPDN